jgi:hypothetical protein
MRKRVISNKQKELLKSNIKLEKLIKLLIEKGLIKKEDLE